MLLFSEWNSLIILGTMQSNCCFYSASLANACCADMICGSSVFSILLFVFSILPFGSIVEQPVRRRDNHEDTRFPYMEHVVLR